MMEDLINAFDEEDRSRADSAATQILTTLMDWTKPENQDLEWEALASGRTRF